MPAEAIFKKSPLQGATGFATEPGAIANQSAPLFDHSETAPTEPDDGDDSTKVWIATFQMLPS